MPDLFYWYTISFVSNELILDFAFDATCSRNQESRKIDTRSVSEKSKARLVLLIELQSRVTGSVFIFLYPSIASPRSQKLSAAFVLRISYQGTKPDLIDVSYHFLRGVASSDCPLSPSEIAILQLGIPSPYTSNKSSKHNLAGTRNLL